jgi:hypothetical protein
LSGRCGDLQLGSREKNGATAVTVSDKSALQKLVASRRLPRGQSARELRDYKANDGSGSPDVSAPTLPSMRPLAVMVPLSARSAVIWLGRWTIDPHVTERDGDGCPGERSRCDANQTRRNRVGIGVRPEEPTVDVKVELDRAARKLDAL